MDNIGSVEVLKPHINEDHWREVIPLAAVLLGRNAKPLVEYLIELSEKDTPVGIGSDHWSSKAFKNFAPAHLANCIASEVSMSPDILKKAIILFVKWRNLINEMNWNINTPMGIDVYDTIVNSKYGNSFEETVKQTLFYELEDDYILAFSDAWHEFQVLRDENVQTIQNIFQLLKKQNREERVTGVLLMMGFSYELTKASCARSTSSNKMSGLNSHILTEVFSAVDDLLQTEDSLSIFSATWCIAHSGYNNADIIPCEAIPKIARRLADLWVLIRNPYDLKRIISWGLCCICTPKLQRAVFEDIPGLTEAIEHNYTSPENNSDRDAAIHMAAVTEHWSKDEIKKRIIEDKGKFAGELLETTRFLKESGFVETEEG